MFQPNEANARLAEEAELARLIQRLPPGVISSPVPGGIASTPTLSEPERAVINVAAIGDNVIVAGSSGFVLEILELVLWNTAINTLNLVDTADVIPLQGPLTLFPANSGYMLPNQGDPHFVLRDGGSFALNLSAAAQVTGFVRFRVRAS